MKLPLKLAILVAQRIVFRWASLFDRLEKIFQAVEAF